MNTPRAKRRRLDPCEALSKPFKSPLKSISTMTQEPPNIFEGQKNPMNATGHFFQPATSTSPANEHPNAEDRGVTASDGTKGTYPSPRPPNLLRMLQSEHMKLLTSLASLRVELDTATQALKLTRSKRDTDLEGFIKVWQSVSQATAEELFAAAKDRVNSMGGLRAWRKVEYARGKGWVDIGDEERNKFDRKGEAIHSDNEEIIDDEVNTHVPLDEDTDEAFTMDMMLQSLNIKSTLIGYDKEGQRWIN